MINEINKKIISKKSSLFLDHLEIKHLNNQPYLKFMKSMIVRVDWEKLSSENFLLPVKRIMKNNNNVYDLNEIINIIELIQESGEVDEKKLYGDVFTPFTVVNDILDKLPKAVWSNPHLKWLDPANGLGNFPITIIQRLMKGLENYIENEQDRYNHIVENMIYMCDVQVNNNLFVSEFFQGNINLYTKSYLRKNFEKHMNDVWNIGKFDIIVSHPPYNSMYDNFTEKSVSLLRDNGYLLQVNPASWRKPQSDRSQTKNMWTILTQNNHLQYLEIHSLRDGKNTFSEYRRYDLLLMQKTKPKKTIIIDEKGIKSEVDLSKWDFLPNYNIEKITKLLGEDCERILFSRTAYGQDRIHVSDEKTDQYKYPLVHYIKEDGPEFKYSSVNDRGFFKMPKIIFGEKGLHDVIIDMNGEYGMTSHSFALKVKNYEEALEIKKFLLSDEFKEIIASCSWGSYSISLSKPPCFIDWRLFTYFKENFWI